MFQSGRLELLKCVFHATYYNFTPKGNPIVRHHHAVKDTPRCNLGPHKTPVGNFRKQTKETLKKAKNSSEAIFHTKATRDETRMKHEMYNIIKNLI